MTRMSKIVNDLSMSTDTISPRVWFTAVGRLQLNCWSDFPKLTTISVASFNTCRNMSTVYLPPRNQWASKKDHPTLVSQQHVPLIFIIFYHLSGDCALHHRSPGCIFVDLGQHAGTVSSRWCSLGGQRWTDWFVGERFGGRNVVDRIYHPPKNTQRAPSKNP